MDSLHRELSIPKSLPSDQECVEIVRAWDGGGKCHVSLRVSAGEDPATWGLLLADLARHAARAYSLKGTHSAEDALLRIAKALRVELLEPTDFVVGDFKGRPERPVEEER